MPHNFGVTLALPTTNAITGVFSPQRGWNWSPQLLPYWESPGGTLFAVVVQHNFNPNATPVVVNAAQLFGRRLMLSVAEGGFTYSASARGPFEGLVSASTNAYPSLFTVSVNYLLR